MEAMYGPSEVSYEVSSKEVILTYIVSLNGNVSSGRPESQIIGDVFDRLDLALIVDVVVGASHDPIAGLHLGAGGVGIGVAKL
jgi:hypothetical protein